MTKISGRNILSGLKEFRRFLNQERATLGATPILLLDSSPLLGSEQSSERSHVPGEHPSELLKHVQLACTSVGLRTTTSRTHPDHYFPSLKDVQETQELAKRIGAASVMGVGGLCAMELAKTIEAEQHILVPGTCAATLFAGASHSLLLDTDESALMPQTSQTPWQLVLADQAISIQDPKVIHLAVYAGLVLSLDALYRGVDNSQEALDKVHQATTLLDQLKEGQEVDSNAVRELLLWTGATMSFGLSSSPRSVPLALASGLVPTQFADYYLLDFIACLLPGVVAMLQDNPHHADMAMQLYHKWNSTCPRLSKTTGDELRKHALLSHVHTDGARWDCVDVDDRVLETVLNASLP